MPSMASGSCDVWRVGLYGMYFLDFQRIGIAHYTKSKWGIDPERDIWSLGVMVQGSGQMGELLGRRRRRRRRRRHLKIGVWNSFSFRAWIGLIWEISPRKPDHSAWNFGARLFCKNPKNQWKSYFQYFQDMVKLEKSNFQYFQDMRKLKNSDFQYL